MPNYLPLCSWRQDLLPASCRSCAWWQTKGIARVDPDTASSLRLRWTASLESEWGHPGLVWVPYDGGESRNKRGSGRDCVVEAAVVHYAPVADTPRIRDLMCAGLPPDAILLFCLRIEGGADPGASRRLLHEALSRLRQQHIHEIYAFAALTGGTPHEERCEFFSHKFLEANGFKELVNCGDIVLMRADLRGLLSLFAPLEAAVRRLLHHHPTPSPAAWSSRRPS